MLSTSIEFLISALGANAITNIFLFVIMAMFLFASACKYQNKAESFVQYVPTLLTSIGILGTFTGIIAGLLGFDVNHIDTSIPPLLEGLKTAFITSLAGMFFSILFKILVTFGVFDKKSEVEPVIVTINDIHDAMLEQTGVLKRLTMHFCEGESSLMGQFKLMRSEHGDNQRRSERYFAHSAHTLTVIQNILSEQQQSLLRTEEYLEYSVLSLKVIQQTINAQQAHFKTFEDHLFVRIEEFTEMSHLATEQVIDALSAVIRDFSDNMTIQFGENFEKLNEAVFALLDWQENYKLLLVDMKNQYEQSVKTISQTEVSVTQISDKVQEIPKAMSALTRVFEVNQHQIDELSRHLDAFADIRDRAVAAVPEIQTRIDNVFANNRLINEEMAKGIQDSAEQLKVTMVTSAESYQDAIERSCYALDDVATATTNATVDLKEQLIAALGDINHNMRDLLEELQAGGMALIQMQAQVQIQASTSEKA